MAPHAESPQNESAIFFDNALPSGQAATTGGSGHPDPDVVKPNILYIMADQLAAPLLKIHDPNSPIKTPNIDRLAAEGVVFENAYCNSPLCAPSRFCMVTGQLPYKIGAFDNGSHLNADIPTYAHYLRREGYETTLAGKMHFVGPDQLHGFEHRLTSDIYPGDFGWQVNWDDPDTRLEWYHNASSVLQAGRCVRSNQLDYDEEVMYKSTQYLYDYVRQGGDKRPFCLTVSLTHPHDPYAIHDEFWDMYEDVEIPMPKVKIPQEEQDSHSKRLLKCTDIWDSNLPEEAIRRARRAYFGACSYVDSNIGKLLKVLKNCHLDKNTIVIFSGDHGDMLGERGLWYKMSWFENSARVPLIVNYPPRFAPRRVPGVVSTMDLLPTLVEMIGGKKESILPIDGKSLYPALLGEPIADEVFGEYMGEGTISPVVMIRRGPWKYITSLVDEPQLFNLENDPEELQNLAKVPEYAITATKFANEAARKWDLQAIHEKVLTSQRMRRVCWAALKQGKFESWDYNPEDDGRKKYIRSTIPLDDLELKARYPAVDALGRPLITASPHGIAGAKGE
ncbi:choline-sulfatase [Verruconis gallopava]|uniref:Choline-sulfatase n=1 Tax=Verruconis gallopava TaxID=253628 RepID=A0A0D1Z9C9_9PEZI|nr:choline-sulfatase [Verruconis gallopava]KIW09567.1 choline-sulfatase [Verruconis gallopava]